MILNIKNETKKARLLINANCDLPIPCQIKNCLKCIKGVEASVRRLANIIFTNMEGLTTDRPNKIPAPADI